MTRLRTGASEAADHAVSEGDSPDPHGGCSAQAAFLTAYFIIGVSPGICHGYRRCSLVPTRDFISIIARFTRSFDVEENSAISMQQRMRR